MSKAETINIIDIPVDKISPSPYQPRIDFELEDLRGSIIKYGIIDPLKVRKVEDHWELIDGERRWRIAQQEGIETVPCIVSEYSDDEADALAWRLNTERKQYTLEERAKHFKSHQDEGLSGAAIGRIHGNHRTTVNRLLAIFRLPEKYSNYMWSGEFGYGKYEYLYEKGLTTFKNDAYASEILHIIDEAVERRLTDREFENVIDDYLSDLAERQVEEAKKAATKLDASKKRVKKASEAIGEPEVKPPETPEELEEAAEALRKEAERRKTPEQKAAEKAEEERIKRETAEKKQREAEEKAREKARNSLLTGKGNAQSRIEKAIEDGIDATEFTGRLKEIEAMITEDPKKAFEEAKKLKNEINSAIRDEEIRKEAAEKAREKERKRFEAEKKRLEAELEEKLRVEKERLAELSKRLEAERVRLEAEAEEKLRVEKERLEEESKRLEAEKERLEAEAESELEAEKKKLRIDPEFIQRVRREIISPPIPKAEREKGPPRIIKSIDEPIHTISVGLNRETFRKLSDFMKSRSMMIEEAVIHLILKGLEADSVGT